MSFNVSRANLNRSQQEKRMAITKDDQPHAVISDLPQASGIIPGN